LKTRTDHFMHPRSANCSPRFEEGPYSVPISYPMRYA
jgi:hypothetical protein